MKNLNKSSIPAQKERFIVAKAHFKDMGKRKGAILALLVIFILGLQYIAGVRGDSNPPDITNAYHTPEYPTNSEKVDVRATVTDPDGVKNVSMQYCQYPAFICTQWMDMTLIGGDIYNITIDPFFSDTYLVDYVIKANDTFDNEVITEFYWMFVAHYIETSMTVEPLSSYITNSVWVNGTAFYGFKNVTGSYPNWSAPAVFSDINISIIGTSDFWLGQTDSAANYSLYITMPLAPSTYTINVTASNRTIEGYNETAMLVQPLIISQSTQLSHTVRYPLESLWVNGTATYNNGSAVPYSNVTVKIIENSQEWYGLTSDEGKFIVEIVAPDTSGNYNVSATVTNQTFAVSNSTTLILVVAPSPIPDLSISSSDITFSDPLPIINKEFTISVGVHNTGTDVASLFYVEVYISSELAFNQLVSSLDAGNVAVLSFNWSTPVNGTYDILVLSDSTNTVSEALEDNNNASKVVDVDGDYDGDGIGDSIDDDDDNDGYPDIIDDFDYDPTEWLDTDNDGVGNNKDDDDDNDGFKDWEERFPLDYNESEDTDWDGVGNNADDDDDNDDVSDINDVFPLNRKEWGDSDGDGLGDFVDWDDDNDGMPDYWELKYELYPTNPEDVLLDNDGDGVKNIDEYSLGTSPKNKDSDGDGVWDSEDHAPMNPQVKFNPDDDSLEKFVLVELLAVSISIILLLFMLTMKYE